jgi:rhodanese-related sulfurtransferase
MIEPISAAEARRRIASGDQLAFVDLREEGPFSRAHPLFAVNIPLSELELTAPRLVPGRSVPILLFDGGQGLAEKAAERLAGLGYAALQPVAGGLEEWCRAGGELFRDVNVPSKALGEWVATYAGTPFISPEELKAETAAGADLLLLDVRPFAEYRVMTIPGSVSAPGVDLLARANGLVRSDDTLVVVNCAGRTRSIIAAQSLINSGLFKRVAALRDGTIGWLLAGYELERGADRRAPPDLRGKASDVLRGAARKLAERAGAAFIDRAELARWEAEAEIRALFRFDVRSPEEFAAGLARGFAHAPGGQLIQATDEYVGVRGARIVLADDDGIRAAMTAGWLAQGGWRHVAVLEGGLTDRPAIAAVEPPVPPDVPAIVPARLATQLAQGQAAVIDLARSPSYTAGHVPGAWLAPRARLAEALPALPAAADLVLTSPDGQLARLAQRELAALTHRPVSVLLDGTIGWTAAGLELEGGLTSPAVPPDDIYKRPYEGTDSPQSAMRRYIDWELQLVEQIHREGGAGFRLI